MTSSPSLSPGTGDVTDNSAALKTSDIGSNIEWGHDWYRAHVASKAHEKSCDDHDLPNCKITTSQSQVEPLAGKIASTLSVTDLLKVSGTDAAVFASTDLSAAVAVRDRSKDKISELTVTGSSSDKPSSNADFYVNKDGVVTVARNPDGNKNTALTIEFELNPASTKKDADLTPDERTSLAAQRAALNVLAQYLRDGYADPSKLKVTDDKNMLEGYLKSPNLEPNTSITAGPIAPDVVPLGIPGMSTHRYPPGVTPPGEIPPAAYRAGMGGYPGMGGGYPPAPRVDYPNASYPQPNAPYAPYGGGNMADRVRASLGNPYFSMGGWNQMENPGQFTLPNTLDTADPFDITGDSFLDWLAASGIDLGHPPSIAKLEAAIKKLEHSNPDLAKTLKSKEFTDMVKQWEGGHAPTKADLAKAVPENLRHEVSKDLIHRYSAEFKDDKGHVDLGKVAVSINVGHIATADDMTKHQDIALAATGPDMSKYQRGQEVPQCDRRTIIAQGLKLGGAAITEQNIQCIDAIIQRESSWIWDNVNNWDSNAAKGVPSIGVMQTIGPTFAENHARGYNNIYNPRDNIAAAVHYIAKRYGGGDPNAGIPLVASRDSGY